MSSQISYTRAAQAAVCAVAADLYWTNGQTTGALLLGVAGTLGPECCRRVGQWVAKRAHPYRIMTQVSFATAALTDQKGVAKALARFRKEFPDDYQFFLEHEKLCSKKEAGIHMQRVLSTGCCSGTVNAIFHRMCQGQSMKESVCDLERREVYYYQILEKWGAVISLEVEMCRKKDKILDDRSKELEILRKWKAYSSSVSVFAEMEQQLTDTIQKMEAETRAEWPMRMEARNRQHLIRNFVHSEDFPVQAPHVTYQRVLEQAMSPLGEQDIVGVLDLPRHVVAFQYGPQGYFFWDAFNEGKGLSQYPDADTFFRELAKNAIEDVSSIKYSRCEEESPKCSPKENRQEAQRRLENTQIHYGIRPLAFLNPDNADTIL